jgi:hypothetical protein
MFDMAEIKEVALAHELKRWIRPDAHRFIRPDWRRFVRPGFENDHPFALYERKYREDQLRDDIGRWADEGGGGGKPSYQRVYAAGLPGIPRQRPPTSPERTAIAKTVAAYLLERGLTNAGEYIAKTSWLYNAILYINSYLDAPKSLEELQAGASTSRLGYDVHHIVEQSSAAEAGQTRNPDYGDLSPREYLRGKDWDERRRVGLDALAKVGVLKR